MECEKWSNFKNIAFFELSDQTNVCFDMPQVYSAIKNHRIHVTTFSCSWPQFDDHTESEKCSNLKIFFELPDQTNVCFDMPQVYSAIKNHMIHVTTLFVLMTSIWWPNGVWKWSNFKNIVFFELPDKQMYVWIWHNNIVRKKRQEVVMTT